MVVFEAATKTYQVEYSKYAKKIIEGKSPKHPIAPLKPMDYSKSYNDYIEMFTVSINDIVELDENKFRLLWLDNWNWKHEFGRSVNEYYNIAAGTTGLESSCNFLSPQVQYYSLDQS